MLHKKNFHQIEENDIELLIQTGETENVNLEFKRRIEKNDAGKKNLLKVVSSFANTLGGCLVVGLGEKSGVSEKFYPFEKTEIDEEIRRLESIVYHNIEPRILGFNTREVKCENYGGSIILMYVPRSYNPPHGVNLNDDIRFYVRRTAHCEQPSVEELRLLFGQQRDIEERVKSFILQRFLRIQANQGAIPLTNFRNAMILHLVPLQEFGELKHDVTNLYENCPSIHVFGSIGRDYFVNLDGVVTYHKNEQICRYTQVFRNGLIESVMDDFITNDQIPSLAVVKWLDEIITFHFKFLESINATPPILMSLAFFGVNGTQMNFGHILSGRPYIEQELQIPMLRIMEYTHDHKYQNIIREQMNFLWNAFGRTKCDLLDDKGNIVKNINVNLH